VDGYEEAEVSGDGEGDSKGERKPLFQNSFSFLKRIDMTVQAKS